jgi:hypothetical protein
MEDAIHKEQLSHCYPDTDFEFPSKLHNDYLPFTGHILLTSI